jgi:hypothetical protein
MRTPVAYDADIKKKVAKKREKRGRRERVVGEKRREIVKHQK